MLALEGEMPGVEGSAGGGVQVTSASVVKLRGVLAVGIEHRLDLAAGDLSDRTYGRVWQKARDQVLAPEEASSRLVRRPYDLRHAAVSTWLNGGVSPIQVAEWAGHSVAVLLAGLRQCIAGQGQAVREQIGRALGLEYSVGECTG